MNYDIGEYSKTKTTNDVDEQLQNLATQQWTKCGRIKKKTDRKRQGSGWILVHPYEGFLTYRA